AAIDAPMRVQRPSSARRSTSRPARRRALRTTRLTRASLRAVERQYERAEAAVRVRRCDLEASDAAVGEVQANVDRDRTRPEQLRELDVRPRDDVHEDARLGGDKRSPGDAYRAVAKPGDEEPADEPRSGEVCRDERRVAPGTGHERTELLSGAQKRVHHAASVDERAGNLSFGK